METRNVNIDNRAWGSEIHIANNEEKKYCGKLLGLREGYRCSIHRHKKDESLYLAKGIVYFEMGEDPENLDSQIIYPGKVIDVFDKIWHRFSGLENSIFVEVSTPDEESERYQGKLGGKIPDFENWRNKILSENGR
ncbi:hypothetical protein CMI43_01990 [Candidatus Pacearchaeota archaeon]|jgi:quercetin dioxygenase-like cupin family protein|nr:hypothetical protein [Candidatus Pacearchaeota archaeon]|tara:strand:- start:296 stop:703 length:408 start_codon:yes stop_codon:yes gene_type:complete